MSLRELQFRIKIPHDKHNNYVGIYTCHLSCIPYKRKLETTCAVIVLPEYNTSPVTYLLYAQCTFHTAYPQEEKSNKYNDCFFFLSATGSQWSLVCVDNMERSRLMGLACCLHLENCRYCALFY